MGQAETQATTAVPGVRVWPCKRCNHRWLARKPGRPARCPNCGDYKWDQPYVNEHPGKKFFMSRYRKPSPGSKGQGMGKKGKGR